MESAVLLTLKNGRNQLRMHVILKLPMFGGSFYDAPAAIEESAQGRRLCGFDPIKLAPPVLGGTMAQWR
jgi:hypothetical protein